MDDELELKENISRMSDEELLEMVTSKAGEYREAALYFARNELKARQIDFEVEREEPSNVEQVEEPGEMLPQFLAATRSVCPVCNSPLRSGTLVAEKEITIVFADNREERFVSVVACRKCGLVSLAVDYDTTVG